MSRSQERLDQIAAEVLDALDRENETLVLAESCTAGLIAATLARVPGMSRRLAGSLVVYQIASKVSWLCIPTETIERHDVVSREVAAMMAERALVQTPHATIAMSITGHLGPNAPTTLDGIAWLAIAGKGSATVTFRLQLVSDSEPNSLENRLDRQSDAVFQALSHLLNRM